MLGCVVLGHNVRVEKDRLRLLGELFRSFAPLGEPCRIWFDFGCCGVCCGFLGVVYSWFVGCVVAAVWLWLVLLGGGWCVV